MGDRQRPRGRRGRFGLRRRGGDRARPAQREVSEMFAVALGNMRDHVPSTCCWVARRRRGDRACHHGPGKAHGATRSPRDRTIPESREAVDPQRGQEGIEKIDEQRGRTVEVPRIAMAVAVGLAAPGGYWVGRASRSDGPLGGPRGEGAVVARSRARLSRERGRGPNARATRRDPESGRLARGRKAFLEDLVREQLLAASRGEGLPADPEFARRYAEELGSFYLQKEFESRRAEGATDDEVRTWFEGHRAELSRPERVRIALIAFTVSSPSEREKKRAQARAALAEVRAKAKDYYGFGNVAGRAPRTRAPGRRAARWGTRAARTSRVRTAGAGAGGVRDEDPERDPGRRGRVRRGVLPREAPRPEAPTSRATRRCGTRCGRGSRASGARRTASGSWTTSGRGRRCGSTTRR